MVDKETKKQVLDSVLEHAKYLNCDQLVREAFHDEIWNEQGEYKPNGKDLGDYIDRVLDVKEWIDKQPRDYSILRLVE